MPQDQGELRNLLALFTQFQKGLLAGVLVQQIGNIRHSTAVVLGHVWVIGCGVLVDGIEGIRMTGGSGDAVEVSLLSGGGSSSSLLSMLVMRLLVHPGRGFLRVVMLAAVHGMVGHHLGDLGGGPRWRASACMDRRVFQMSSWIGILAKEQRDRSRQVEGGVFSSSRSAEGCFETAAVEKRSRGSGRFATRRLE